MSETKGKYVYRKENCQERTMVEYVEKSVLNEVLDKEYNRYLDLMKHESARVVMLIRRLVNRMPVTKTMPVSYTTWVEDPPVSIRCESCGYRAGNWKASEYKFCPACGRTVRKGDNYKQTTGLPEIHI